MDRLKMDNVRTFENMPKIISKAYHFEQMNMIGVAIGEGEHQIRIKVKPSLDLMNEILKGKHMVSNTKGDTNDRRG